MLFILFDIEVVFLYPVALQLEAFGCSRSVETVIFVVAAAGRVRVRLAKGSAGMEVTRTEGRHRQDLRRAQQLRAQQMLRGDIEGDDLEKYVEERLLLTKLETAQNWARKNALFPLGFGLACCAIEMITVIGSPRNDLSRFGAEVIRFSPRQADMLILSGRVSIKMAPVIRRLYDQMLEPKWVIAMGACSSSAGMFNNYAVVAGRRQVPARRRLRARLPAAARGADLRDHEAAGQDHRRTRPGLARALRGRGHRGGRPSCLTRPGSS